VLVVTYGGHAVSVLKFVLWFGLVGIVGVRRSDRVGVCGLCCCGPRYSFCGLPDYKGLLS
jgi:hypothetical protein